MDTNPTRHKPRDREHDIDEGGSLQKYFAGIPHTVIRGRYSYGLSVYAKWLYVYLKSRAGDKGNCTCSTTTIAREAGMSRGQVSAAKRELAKSGLIVVSPGKNPRRHSDLIRIKDIWLANMQEFSVQDTNTEEDEDRTSFQGDSYKTVHNMNTEKVEPKPSVHDMNSLHTPEVLEPCGDTPSSVQEMNAEPESVFTIRTECSYGEQGVHSMNQRRSQEEDPIKKNTPSVSTDVETSPQPLRPELLVQWYNAETPASHPKVQKLSPARRKKALHYIRLFPDHAFWHLVFAEICQSAFLQGLKAKPGHEGFCADFDWLLSTGRSGTENCVKTHEGRYRDTNSHAQHHDLGAAIAQKLQEEADHATE